MFKRISISLILCLVLTSSFSFAKTQKEEYQNDYLYSEAYFDYLIECAEIERDKEAEIQKQAQKEFEDKVKAKNNDINNEIFLNEVQEEIVSKDLEPFKLKIETTSKFSPSSILPPSFSYSIMLPFKI